MTSPCWMIITAEDSIICDQALVFARRSVDQPAWAASTWPQVSPGKRSTGGAAHARPNHVGTRHKARRQRAIWIMGTTLAQSRLARRLPIYALNLTCIGGNGGGSRVERGAVAVAGFGLA